MAKLTVHRGRLVLPIGSPLVPDGAVAVADGTVVAVGRFDDVVGGNEATEVIEWDGVILPGLVNAHTHLQYSSFDVVGSVSYAHYEEWSERFVTEYEARSQEDWATTARRGIEAAIDTGTTCFADVVTDVGALSALVDAGVAGVSYFELIGVDRWAWEAGVEAQLIEAIEAAQESEVARVGISPHAPYSLDEPVLRGMASLARKLGRRLHVHLAESDGEDSYYRTGTGSLAERVAMRVGRRWGILADGGVGMGAAEYADACGLLGPDSHIAHGVYLDEIGRRLLRDTGTYLALCPRSNRTVGVGDPPVAAYLTEGNKIAVGTDSLGSTPSLDLMSDVALLHDIARAGGYERADLAGRLLRAATLGGAEAVGLAHRVGSLEPGKRADLAIFAVDGPDEQIVDLLASGAGRCVATLIAGEKW